MRKSNYLKITATVAILCLAAPGILSVVFNLAGPEIFARRSLEKSALKEVFPGAYSFKPVREKKEIIYYKALDRAGNILGFAFKASKRGYSSDIMTMVGMDADGVISRIKILEENETPGIGAGITEKPWFQGQFSGKRIDGLEAQVNTITGATISSKAVIDSIRERGRQIMEKVKHG